MTIAKPGFGPVCGLGHGRTDERPMVGEMTDEEQARAKVFGLLAQWCGEVGEMFTITVSEDTPEGEGDRTRRPRRVLWYSGDSFGFSAEYRAMTWMELVPLMEAEPEGFMYEHEWDLRKSAEELMMPLQD